MANMVAVITYERYGAIKVLQVAWTSDDAAGTFEVNTEKINGSLLHAITNPGAAAPTADYDVTIKDADGGDVLANCTDDLTDRHTANTERVDFVITEGGRPTVSDILTIAGAACGNAKTGTVRLYYALGDVS